MFIRAKNVLIATTKDGQSPIYPGRTVEVDDEVGREFINLHVADEMHASVPDLTADSVPDENPTGSTPMIEDAPEGQKTDDSDEYETASLEELSYSDLQRIARDMGIDTGKIRKKEALISAIAEHAETGIPADEPPPVMAVQEVIE